MRDLRLFAGLTALITLVWTIAWKGDTGFGCIAPEILSIGASKKRHHSAMDSIASVQEKSVGEGFSMNIRISSWIIYASCVVDAV